MRLIEDLTRQIDTLDDQVRFTIGSISAFPGAINTIASKVTFTIDLRHPNARILDDLIALIENTCDTWREVNLRQLLKSPPVRFDDQIINALRLAANTIGPSMDIISGATHDAKYIAEIAPTGMIFIPCENGISHNEAERAKAPDMIAGANVLMQSLFSLDEMLTDPA